MAIHYTNTPNQRFIEVTNRFPVDTHALGADVSRHQGEVSFETMRKRGVRYIAIRTSVGNYYLDPMCEVYYRNALADDIYPTDYHVIRADNSVVSQMDKYFLNRPSGDTPPIWPTILDNEVKGKSVTIYKNKKGTKFDIIYKKFSPARITDILLGCKEKIEERDGATPLHYADLFFLFDNIEDVSEVWEMDLIIAQYGTLTPGRLEPRFQKRLDALNNGKGIQDLICFWQGLADRDNQGAYFGSESRDLDIDFYMKGGIDDFISRYISKEEPTEPQPGGLFPLDHVVGDRDINNILNEHVDAINALHRRTSE